MQGPEEQSPETRKVIDEDGKGKEKVIEVIEEPEAESEGQEDLKPKMKRLKKRADSEEVKDELLMPLQVVNAGEEVKGDIEGRIWEAARKRASQFKAQAE